MASTGGKTDSDDDLFLPPPHRSIAPDLSAPTARPSWQRERRHSAEGVSAEKQSSWPLESCASLVDGLLFEIYDRYQFTSRDSFDSDTFTEYSSACELFNGRHDSVPSDIERKNPARFNQSLLQNKSLAELRALVQQREVRVLQISHRLVRQLKKRDRWLAKVRKNTDVITAVLQAASLKRRVDTRIRFSISPLSGGDDAFEQWRDGMKAVARLPRGIPTEFRRKVWLSLADSHICSINIDWSKTCRFAFNERSNPDDNKLGAQIVKDLHRTGWNGFSGDDDQQRALLKRVLLAYARWNKNVGYCQGFNVLAALVLQVMERREDDALKVMIYIIDHVLPESYFANNLRALSVDMAVFREMLATHLPPLSQHLDHLQVQARDRSTGANYEPPLTNVFTMQWFLTLFATCLPQETTLRVWDVVLLEGSEVLLRVALSIWERLQEHILAVQSADEFYTAMGSLTRDILNTDMVNCDELIKRIYSYGTFPYPQLLEMREKFTYNITPFSATMSSGRRPGARALNLFADDDEMDEDELAENINCFTGILPLNPASCNPRSSLGLGNEEKAKSNQSFDISKVSPGAYSAHSEVENEGGEMPALLERMTMDIDMLKNQYKRLRYRQKQAHIVLAAANQNKPADTKMSQSSPARGRVAPPIQSPMAVNHLLLARTPQKGGRNRTVAQAPVIGSFLEEDAQVDTPRSKHSITSKQETVAGKCENKIEAGQERAFTSYGDSQTPEVKHQNGSDRNNDESTVISGSTLTIKAEKSALAEEQKSRVKISKSLGQTVPPQMSIDNPTIGDDPTTEATEQRVFNPFPITHVSRNRTKNGIKLGLYPANPS